MARQPAGFGSSGGVPNKAKQSGVTIKGQEFGATTVTRPNQPNQNDQRDTTVPQTTLVSK